jgi:uncharacterized protein
MDFTEQKRDCLSRAVRSLESTAVAYSGGVDSALVLKVAVDVLGPEHAVAVTGRSPSLAESEFNEAKRLAERIGAEHVVLETDEFANPDYVRNPVNRCYFCKSTLYTRMKELVAERGLRTISNGTNADDLGDHRPGLQAAREFGVRSPLVEAGFTKADVRELSRRLGLPTHDKPAAPCLSSRVQYGELITPEKLRRIEAAEAFLHGLGIRECRVRLHDDLARIEVSPDWFPLLTAPETARVVEQHFRSLGFTYVTLDLRGFRSGSLNERLQI